MKKKNLRIGIGAVFALAIMCTVPVSSFAKVIFSENYDSITSGWNCSKATPSAWTNGSACTSRSIGGITHYGGEISSGGRSGNSLKQWKGPGTTEGGYDGYLNKIFNSTEFANHYRTLYSRVYVRISSELDATGCAGECPKFMGRISGGTAGDSGLSTYQVLLDLKAGRMKSSNWHIYIVGASAPFDNMYSTVSAASLGLFDGNWHCVELGVKISDTGQSNGEVHLYFDGKELTLTGGSGESPSVGQTHIAYNWPSNMFITWPLVPGVGNLTPEGGAQWTTTNNQWGSIEWDDLVVSTTYIGPDSGGTTGGGTTPPTTPPVVNGTCGSASGKSYTSLTSGSSNLCATGTVASFAGTGPWTWGCNGSGGGVSTSSKACSASLTPPPVTTPPADTTAPTIRITSPTTRSSYSTASSTITLSGTASDNVACSSVKWTCPTCTPSSGTATGTTSWSLPSVSLASGSNAITVTAKDSSNNTSADSITVTSTAVVSTGINGTCGSASGQSYATLTSGSANLCATGTVASFTGTGPWKWGCNGSGGGTNTAATACSAALSSQTVLFSENFEDNNYLNRGWYDGTHFDIINSQHAGGSQAAQFSFAQGATSWTGSTGAMRHLFTPTDSLYVSYYIKFSSGWRGSQKNYHPHFIHIASDLDDQWCPLANNYLEAYSEFIADVGSPYTIRPQLALQDEKRVNMSNGTPPNNLSSITENRSVNYCNTPLSSGATGTCYADSTYYSSNEWRASAAAVSTNTWHHVEIYLKMNSISGGKGQSNGVMQEWIDGSLVINHSDVLYRTNQDATKKWAQFVMAPYISDGSPIAQTIWFDDLTVATAPPSNATSLSAPTGFIGVPK